MRLERHLSRSRRALLSRLRRRWPDRVITRDVQGVRLSLPWSHRLPDYAKKYPTYGQNLVATAAVIAAIEGRFDVIDLGANVGDSALQILTRADARVLCVEGDPYWLRFLEENTGDESRITITEALLREEGDLKPAMTPIRRDGTTRFVRTSAPQAKGATISAKDLRRAWARLDNVRLIKSDVDGFDCRLVPELAAAWSQSHPVLFFEYDPQLAISAGDPDPGKIWASIRELGYQQVAVWDNYGRPIGVYCTDGMVEPEIMLKDAIDCRDYHYWDVAVTHALDDRLATRLKALVLQEV